MSSFNENHPCVFVLSTGRAGTETLAALFGFADNVIAYHEPSPKLYSFSKMAYEYFDDPFTRKVLTEALLALRSELLNRSLDYGRGYAETSPQVTFLAPAILNAYPDARFVHLVRDPREVVTSGMRRKWFEGNPNDKYRIVPGPSSEAGRKWRSYNTFQKNLWLWSETNRWISQFLSTVPPQRKLLVHSEDVFEGRDESIRRLFDFIKASVPPRRKIMGLLKKKLNAQRSGIFPNPSNWSQEMNKELYVLAGEVALDLGYKLLEPKSSNGDYV